MQKKKERLKADEKSRWKALCATLQLAVLPQFPASATSQVPFSPFLEMPENSGHCEPP